MGGDLGIGPAHVNAHDIGVAPWAVDRDAFLEIVESILRGMNAEPNPTQGGGFSR